MTEKQELEFEMKDEYDFSKGRPNPYAARARTAANTVVIEPELYEMFPSAEAVNEALRLVAQAVRLAGKADFERRKAS